MKKIDVLEMRNVEAGTNELNFDISFDDGELEIKIGGLEFNFGFDVSRFGFPLFKFFSFEGLKDNHLYFEPWKWYRSVVKWIFG